MPGSRFSPSTRSPMGSVSPPPEAITRYRILRTPMLPQFSYPGYIYFIIYFGYALKRFPVGLILDATSRRSYFSILGIKCATCHELLPQFSNSSECYVCLFEKSPGAHQSWQSVNNHRGYVSINQCGMHGELPPRRLKSMTKVPCV